MPNCPLVRNLDKFQDELYELRRKYHISGLLWVAQLHVAYDDGDEGTAMVEGYFGDVSHAESVAAFAVLVLLLPFVTMLSSICEEPPHCSPPY